MFIIFPEDIVFTKIVCDNNHTWHQSIKGQRKVIKGKWNPNMKSRFLLHRKVPYNNKRGRKGLNR